MATSPVALNTSSFNWRDPATTNPVGRLQGDVKHYQFGGTQSVDNPNGLLGPDGNPLCGIGVDLEGLSQSGVDAGDGSTTGVIDPPANYRNPLRITEDGELWFDPTIYPVYREVCQEERFPDRQVVGGDGTSSLGAAISLCVSNPSTETCLIRRRISVLNAAIIDPPPTAGAGQTVAFDVATPTYTIPADAIQAGQDLILNPDGLGNASITCAQIEGCDDARSEVLYSVRVDGGFDINVVRACTGTCPTNTVEYQMPDVFVGPGLTNTITVEPILQELAAPVGPYQVVPGFVRVCAQLICLPAGATYPETPTC